MAAMLVGAPPYPDCRGVMRLFQLCNRGCSRNQLFPKGNRTNTPPAHTAPTSPPGTHATRSSTMDASITAIRRMQSHAGYALVTILMELGIAACEAIARRAEAFNERQRQAAARNELRRLSDRALKDIGLERGEIESLFR